jgi:hypothetical protein
VSSPKNAGFICPKGPATEGAPLQSSSPSAPFAAPQFPVWHVKVPSGFLTHSVRPQKLPPQVNTAWHLQLLSAEVHSRLSDLPAAQVLLMQSEFCVHEAPETPLPPVGPGADVGPSGTQIIDCPPFAGSCHAEPELGGGLDSDVGSRFSK